MIPGLSRLKLFGFHWLRAIPVLIVSTLFGLTSCVEDEMPPALISLLHEPGLVSHDTTLAAGKVFSIGIEALAGKDPLTNITIKSSTGGTLLDSGIHASQIRLIKLISKGISDTERITITVMDMGRNRASVSILLLRDMNAAFGPIVTYSSLKIGAQASPAYNSCLSLQQGHIFPVDSATILQNLIDILYYYNPGGGVPIYASVFSSPGETEAPGFYPFLNTWTIKNNTYYNITTTITATDFNACNNDSLIIAAYDEGTSKRKLKNALAGNIIPFRIANGKKGIIFIKDIQGTTAGFAGISIKIQE